MAKALFKKEGLDNPTNKQLQQRIDELKQSNLNIEDGELKNKRITAKVAPEMHLRIAKTEKASKAQKQTAMDIQTQLLTDAQKALTQQLKEDGWAGDVADGVSVLWGSDNRAVKVQADIDKTKSNLKDLETASKARDQQFRAKFKEIYGVAYNHDNIQAYKNSPSDENYKKAFGNNNIGNRVAVYNQSQKDGAAAVKSTGVIAASTAAAFATGGMSVVATAVAIGATTATARIVMDTTDLATNQVDGDVSENIDNITQQAVQEGLIAGSTAGLMKGVSIKMNTP